MCSERFGRDDTTTSQRIEMIKQALIGLTAAALLAGCGGEDKAQAPAAKAADGTKTVGLVQLVEHPALDAASRGIQDAVKARGLKVTFDVQNAQADQSNLANIAQRFVSQEYPLIFAVATPAAQTMANAAKNTPIVATAVTDYEAAKLVINKDKPGTNVTGSSDLNPIGAQLDLIMQFVPNAKTIGTIYNSSEINSQFQVEILKKELARYNVTLVEGTVSSVNDVQQVAQGLIGKIDALYVPTDNTAANNAELIGNISLDTGTPIIAGEEGICKGCGVATLSIDYYELGRTTGEMAVKILKGEADISTMPVEFAPTATKQANMANCEKLGITVPDDYVAIQ